jgi:hypothetical protein
MANFEDMTFLLELLKLNIVEKNIGVIMLVGGMAEILHTIVVQAIKVGLVGIETNGQKRV